MQHSIDLLPQAIRARSQAGLRAGRMIAGAMIAVVVLLLMAGHSLVALVRAQEALFESSTNAEEIFTAEARIHELRAAIKRTNSYLEQYQRIAFPVDVSAVIATVIRELPDSVTLDQLDLDAGARLVNRSPRSRGSDPKEAPPRVLQGEVSGFAASDSQIAELVTRLSHTAPFRDVTLDFSRTRDVYGHDAREFRLSFKIDLDAALDVTYRNASSPSLAQPNAGFRSIQEVANVPN